MELSKAELARRSNLAKELHKKKDPVTGRSMFGGPQPGSGRPRKRRATEIINEHVEDHAEEIFERMLRALRGKNDYIALQAARQMVDVTNKETEIQLREERSLEETPTPELVEIVASRLARLAEAGHIPSDFIEADSEEITGEPPELNEGESFDDEPPGLDEDSPGSTGLGASPFGRRSTE